LSAIQLTLASAAIAAASVFTAGGDFQAVALGGILAALILQGFWTGVISGVSGTALISGIPCMAAADEITKVMWCDIDQYRRHISPTWGTTAMRAYVEKALRTGQQAES